MNIWIIECRTASCGWVPAILDTAVWTEKRDAKENLADFKRAMKPSEKRNYRIAEYKAVEE